MNRPLFPTSSTLNLIFLSKTSTLNTQYSTTLSEYSQISNKITDSNLLTLLRPTVNHSASSAPPKEDNMNQRRSSAGRPTGTDGYDFSYRMVVDSRYTKVAKQKSRLSSLLLIQGLVLLVDVVPILLQVAKWEEPNVLRLSSAAISFLSLVVGEIGRRQSRSAFLKIYLIVSFATMFLSVAFAMKSNIIFEVIQNGVANCWESKKLQLIEVLHLFIDVLLKIGAALTTLSLIHNMSPPKKSS